MTFGVCCPVDVQLQYPTDVQNMFSIYEPYKCGCPGQGKDVLGTFCAVWDTGQTKRCLKKRLKKYKSYVRNEDFAALLSLSTAGVPAMNMNFLQLESFKSFLSVRIWTFGKFSIFWKNSNNLVNDPFNTTYFPNIWKTFFPWFSRFSLHFFLYFCFMSTDGAKCRVSHVY